MIRKSILIIALAATSLSAALGSGPFVRTGIGFGFLGGTDLYMIPSESHYRTIRSDSVFYYYHDFASSRALFRPLFVFGWEQSFFPVFSLNGGAGLAFSGASWKANKTYYPNGTYTVAPIDGKLNMTYITVPIDAKLMLPINSGGFSFSFGPRFAVLCNTQFENRILSTKINESSLYHPLSMGIGFGFGGEIRLRKMDLLMALRLDAGLTNESKDELLILRHSMAYFETGLRWTTKRHTKSAKWPL
jgi:hypothetical protein